MANELKARFCPKCGGQLGEFVGTQTECPNCHHNLKTEFGDNDSQQIDDEVDIGVGALKQVKMARAAAEKAQWELEKEKYLFHEQRGTKQCPRCREIVPVRSKFCLECSAPFDSAFNEPPIGYTPSRIDYTPSHIVNVQNAGEAGKQCKQCGMLMKIGATFCPQCGHKQPA